MKSAKYISSEIQATSLRVNNFTNKLIQNEPIQEFSVLEIRKVH
jgi:hypothetical protein